jgi:hypothetical protein
MAFTPEERPSLVFFGSKYNILNKPAFRIRGSTSRDQRTHAECQSVGYSCLSLGRSINGRTRGEALLTAGNLQLNQTVSCS